MPYETTEFNPREILSERELERDIDWKIYRIQLDFLRQLRLETGENLDTLLDKYSDVIESFGHGLPNSKQNLEIIKTKKAELKHRLLALDGIDQEEWTDKAAEIIHELDMELNEQYPPAAVEKAPKLGGFIYNIHDQHAESGDPYQLRPGATYLELHFPIKAIENAGEQKNVSPKASLETVARFIVQEHPEIQAVVGGSWLMSHPLAERLGFKKTKTFSADRIVSDLENPFKTHSYWLQLLDEDGNIKKDAAEYLRENKKLPYDLTYAKMDTVDFLDKYLPAELRGEVTLKENSDLYHELNETMQGELQIFKAEWDKLKADEIASKISELMPTYLKLIKENCDIDNFIEILKDLKAKNLDVESVGESEKLKEAVKPARDYLDRIKYQDEKIIVN